MAMACACACACAWVAWGLWAVPAYGWDTIGASWDVMPIPYQVSDDLGVPDAEGLAAIQAAFATWEGVDCAGVTFDYQGRTSAGFAELDGHNTVSVIGAGWPAEHALASTPSLTQEGNLLVEADLALNAEDHAWVTDDRADGRVLLDLQAGVTHEVGHLLGLWHSTDPEATLNPALVGNPEARTLADDDIEGLCTLYQGGVHVGAEIGEACAEKSDCAGGLDCLADADGQYCAPTCPADGTCPDGYRCIGAAAGQDVCARAVGCGCAGTGSGVGVGAPLALGALASARRRRRSR